MIKAILQYKNKNLILRIPYNRVDIVEPLLSIGISNSAGEIFIRDKENNGISVKLFSYMGLGNRLISLFGEAVTLSTVNTVCDLIVGLPEEQRDEISYELAHGEYDTLPELLSAVKKFAVPQEQESNSMAME